MAFVEINKNPPRAQLASFGRLWTPVFAMFFSLMFWNAALFLGCVISLIIGVLIALIGWINPQWLKPVFVTLAIVTFPLGMFIGFVLMAGVYYLCIVPIGVMLRIFGKDPLTKRWDREAESYWIERSDMAPVAQYFKQF
ncbi:MAG: hypothetical protein CMJ82_07480 [Planctomycetaceae bacterium]|nr:hypothetical protein [Planctomycetaceae bacterium]|tara:strand:+ start:76 stop:492 length:417 start_codon:yes stop_codon:yes gene_type:complete